MAAHDLEAHNVDPPRPVTDFPFVERSGLEVLHVERGRAILRLPLEPNVNHVGWAYAGALFTLAEIPGGVLFGGAFDITRFYPIVGEMSIRFVAPATTATTVDARMSDEEVERVTAELEARGKSRYVLEQTLTDDAGNVVATTSATYFGLSF
jgi:thioesterase domain-containing protein